MDDKDILELYLRRDEEAIKQTSDKYRSYCMKIAMNILGSAEDSEECINDAYLAAWNSIPPKMPQILKAYLGKLTRNISLNRYNLMTAQKRGGGDFALSLDELSDCIADSEKDEEQLAALIDGFLYTQSKKARQIFVRRYFYCDPVAKIAKLFGISESSVKSMLFRTRERLRRYLAENGISV
ncbi:MAG: sigma-70 family RNA polymerase sigma factor [Clostridia bacterium]|nr:sigma-70 family RNA polymerase sigma factor [Clostridia bacterium]